MDGQTVLRSPSPRQLNGMSHGSVEKASVNIVQVSHHGKTYIPHDDGPLFPLYSGLEIGAKSNMIIQELEDSIALLLFIPND